MSRLRDLRDLHHRAPSHRDRRRPLVLTPPLGSIRVCLPLLAIAGLLTGSSWVLEAWLLAGPAPAWDLAGLGWAAEQRDSPTIALARLVTHLCDLPVVAALAAALVVLARVRTGRWDAARLVMAVLGGTLLITAVSKELTDRARPAGALGPPTSSPASPWAWCGSWRSSR